MATQSKFFYSGHQPTGAGDEEAATRNYLSRKKSKSIIQPDFGAPVCNLSPFQTDRIAQEYRHSFIAFVVGKDIRPWQLGGRLHRHFRLTNFVEVSELDRGCFVLKLSEKDYEALLLEDRPWSIPNLCIYAFPWIRNFKPSEAMFHVVDAWIRLHELPIEYYDDESLRKIAETIGQVLVKIDPVTKGRKKCKYARICVRINFCNPLPSRIKIDEIQQEIEYEGFDLLCPRCGLIVDQKHNCLRNPSGCSRFDPQYRRARSFQEIGSSSSSIQPLISSGPSVAWGSRYQVLGEESKAVLLDLNELNDWPSLPVGGYQRTATRTSTSSLQPQLLGLLAEPIENQNEIYGVSVQTLPNLPKESAHQQEVFQNYPIFISSNPEAASSSTTIEVSVELEQNNLIPSTAFHDHPMSISSYPEATTSTTITTSEFEQSNSIPSIALFDHPKTAASTTTTTPEFEQSNLIPSIASLYHPNAAASTTTTTPELEQNNLIPSIASNDHTMSIPSYPAAAPAEIELNILNMSISLAPSVVEDQFRAIETSSSATIAVHYNQPQPSLSAASIPSQQPSPTSETALTFYSNVIKRSIIEKEVTNTPSKGNSINRRPILYTIDPSITSFAVGLSESPDSVPEQNQFVINLMSTSRSGNEQGIGSEEVSASHAKKMLGWKFCGRDNANLIEGLKYVVQEYEPSIVVIFATRISDDDVEGVVEELAFHGSYCKKFDDYNRGVWLLMFRQDVQTEVFEVEVNQYSAQEVSASAYFHLETYEPLLGFSYADTETSWQTWGSASFCGSTYSMANTLAY